MSNQDLRTRFTAAVSNYRASGREVVVVFEQILTVFSENLIPADLEFSLNALAEFPRLQRHAAKFVNSLEGIKAVVDKDTKAFAVSLWALDENGKKVEVATLSKKRKAKLRAGLDEFIKAEYTSILNWEPEKGDKKVVVFDFIKAQKSMVDGIEKQIKAGLSLDMAIQSLQAKIVELQARSAAAASAAPVVESDEDDAAELDETPATESVETEAISEQVAE